MTDTQSPTESQTTIDDARARSRRSFIAALKANRDVFSNLPEKIEQWFEKETRATNQPEATEHGRDESDGLARSDTKKQLECFQAEINANTQRYVERELKEKEDTIEANKEQLKLVEEETEGLTNEHQKEVDKLLREIQTMKEKNLKLKEESKKKEEEAKEKIKELEGSTRPGTLFRAH